MTRESDVGEAISLLEKAADQLRIYSGIPPQIPPRNSVESCTREELLDLLGRGTFRDAKEYQKAVARGPGSVKIRT